MTVLVDSNNLVDQMQLERGESIWSTGIIKAQSQLIWRLTKDRFKQLHIRLLARHNDSRAAESLLGWQERRRRMRIDVTSRRLLATLHRHVQPERFAQRRMSPREIKGNRLDELGSEDL